MHSSSSSYSLFISFIWKWKSAYRKRIKKKKRFRVEECVCIEGIKNGRNLPEKKSTVNHSMQRERERYFKNPWSTSKSIHYTKSQCVLFHGLKTAARHTEQQLSVKPFSFQVFKYIQSKFYRLKWDFEIKNEIRDVKFSTCCCSLLHPFTPEEISSFLCS